MEENIPYKVTLQLYDQFSCDWLLQKKEKAIIMSKRFPFMYKNVEIYQRNILEYEKFLESILFNESEIAEKGIIEIIFNYF